MKNRNRRKPPRGYVRLKQIVGDRRAKPPVPGLLPIGASTWWQGVKEHRFPQPIRFRGLRCTFWHIDEVLGLDIDEEENDDDDD